MATHFPDQVVDFISAFLVDLDDESRADAAGRCLVISGAEAWNAMVAQKEKLILIADSTLDLNGEPGTKLIQKCRRAGHAVIFGGAAGGIPDPASAPLPAPRTHQLKDALEEAGYGEERARTLAQKSGGNIGSLLRCLQNLSLMPEWAEGTIAADLAIAEAVGSWDESSDADRAVVEGIAGKVYGEWIGRMREIALRPGTPLTQQAGNWKFVARYEGWYALGPRLFDEHLDRLLRAAISVLRENDPQFDLPTEERYAARIHGKVLSHSQRLRNGLADSLALLGSHSQALTSCTLGKAAAAAARTVRELLADADWSRWASLNDLLPLLAEAAPREFLKAVENTLNSVPCPFDEVFAQEGDGLMGGNYLTGVLWALETLAWDADNLSSVVILLGELSARDPGGRWANRPSNSLTAILLPWLPQTCAPVAKRRAAVSTLLAELPHIGWKLLLSLLPQARSTSDFTRRPAWRETIPDDWSRGVTQREYWEQSEFYSEMAINAAKNSREKLAELIDRLENLPPSALDQFLAHLGSSSIIKMPEADRLGLWTKLGDLVMRHRKFSATEWAMKPEQVDKIAALADRLAPVAPAYRHQRLFGEREFDLYEEKGNYEDQLRDLENRRQEAIKEIYVKGGSQAVFAFAVAVQSPWRVGLAFGSLAEEEVDRLILPEFFEAEEKPLAQFAGGFVWGRFNQCDWPWVDNVDTSQWDRVQIGQLLSYLPFKQGTWERSKRLLGEDESEYWRKTSANPYQAETGLEHPIDKLLQHGRPNVALRCLNRMLHGGQPFHSEQAVRALVAALESTEGAHSLDGYQIVEIIKALQEDPNTNQNDLSRMEWAYLPLLDYHENFSPKLLWRRLATEPTFFCEVIRLVFASKNEERSPQESTEGKRKIVVNAYRLLSEWRNPPGCREDGRYDGDTLAVWLDTVKRVCSETGHLEVAMTVIGQALNHVPSDPGGLWIHRSAAAALNTKDAKDMRDGFRTGLLNSRGAHYVDPTGAPERELAGKYRNQAEDVESAGFHRLATTLRELAESYVRQAEWVATTELSDSF